MIVGFLIASAGTYVIAEEEPLSPEAIARVWKERGSEALSRLDSLEKKDDIRSKYQYLLESLSLRTQQLINQKHLILFT